MTTIDAVMTIECDDTATQADILQAFQFLVDSGDVWSLQGWYGRTAKALIDEGLIQPAKEAV